MRGVKQKAAEPPSLFEALPLPVIARVLQLVSLEDKSIQVTAFASLGTTVAAAAYQAFFERVELPDDDELLERAESEEQLGAPKSLVASMLWSNSKAASACKKLSIVPAIHKKGTRAAPLESDSFDTVGSTRPPKDCFCPMSEIPLLFLLSRLSNLQNFEWLSDRLPPPHITQALGLATRSLNAFSFCPSSSLELPRWDADHLSALPVSLSHLRLSNFSIEAHRSLIEAFETDALPWLEKLDLEATLFVDDALLEAIAEGCPKLQRLRIADMSGTKLTERGLKRVFDECSVLESIALDCVEGRLSKSCWKKLTLPRNLHTVKLTFAETGPHKSWMADQLDSIAALCSSPYLSSLAVARRPPRQALIPGANLAHYPIDDAVALKTIPQEVLDTLLARGNDWKTLDLDFWSVAVGDLKRILEKCSQLNSLKVYLDTPFRSLLNLAPSFAVAHRLRTLIVSINPERTPELWRLAGALSPSSSPAARNLPLPAGSAEHKEAPASSSLAEWMAPSIPNAKEWKRFHKKAHTLRTLQWTGRGGLGTWHFTHSTARDVRVDFEPLPILAEVSDVQPRRSSLSPTRADEAIWASQGNRGRRASSVSLAGSCLSSLLVDTAADDPSLGLGLARSSSSDGPRAMPGSPTSKRKVSDPWEKTSSSPSVPSSATLERRRSSTTGHSFVNTTSKVSSRSHAPPTTPKPSLSSVNKSPPTQPSLAPQKAATAAWVSAAMRGNAKQPPTPTPAGAQNGSGPPTKAKSTPSGLTSPSLKIVHPLPSKPQSGPAAKLLPTPSPAPSSRAATSSTSTSGGTTSKGSSSVAASSKSAISATKASVTRDGNATGRAQGSSVGGSTGSKSGATPGFKKEKK